MKLYFRFWDEEKQKMIYNHPYNIEQEEHLMINTKIKDDAGRDIYEGDIVKQKSTTCRFGLEREVVGYVVANSLGKYFIKYYKNGRAETWYLSEDSYDYEEMFEKEVLGNIYENKNLFERIKKGVIGVVQDF